MPKSSRHPSPKDLKLLSSQTLSLPPPRWKGEQTWVVIDKFVREELKQAGNEKEMDSSPGLASSSLCDLGQITGPLWAFTYFPSMIMLKWTI